jgi:hypothetical protein
MRDRVLPARRAITNAPHLSKIRRSRAFMAAAARVSLKTENG